MILIEQQIESALRTAIRASLQAASATVPELATARIIGFWLPPENDGDSNDAEGLRVELKAMPNGSAGWMSGVGFEPLRNVSVSVECYTQPDSDSGKATCNALYAAVRNVFEAPGSFALPAGINFGGMLITGGGAAEFEDGGQVFGFTIEMKVSL